MWMAMLCVLGVRGGDRVRVRDRSRGGGGGGVGVGGGGGLRVLFSLSSCVSPTLLRLFRLGFPAACTLL